MGDAFTTALKISAVIGCAAIPYGPLAVVIFICSLVILTIVIYIYRLIIPQKPIDNEYEIKNMCKEYIKWVISMINKSIPLKKGIRLFAPMSPLLVNLLSSVIILMILPMGLIWILTK